MNELKSEWNAEAAEAWIAKHRQKDGFVYNEDIFALFAKAEATLSAQPSPDAAQEPDMQIERMLDEVLIAKEKYERWHHIVEHTETDKVLMRQDREAYEVARKAITGRFDTLQTCLSASQAMRKLERAGWPDAAQGSEHGGEVPMEFVREMLGAWPKIGLAHPLTATHCIRYIAQRAIDRQNRAPQPVQKPVAWILKGDLEALASDEDGAADVILLRDFPRSEEFVPLYTSPQPVQGVAESVEDEERLNALMVDLANATMDYVQKGNTDEHFKAMVKADNALRTFFKQSLSHSSKGDEHG